MYYLDYEDFLFMYPILENSLDYIDEMLGNEAPLPIVYCLNVYVCKC